MSERNISSNRETEPAMPTAPLTDHAIWCSYYYRLAAYRHREIERLRAAHQAIVDRYHPDGNPMYPHDIALEALENSANDTLACNADCVRNGEPGRDCPKHGDRLGAEIYSLLVRRGFAQHEASAISNGPGGGQWQPVETLGKYPEYTNEIGDAGHRYMQQRCGGHISSGFFYWHELWDALNVAAYSSKETTALPTAYRPECEGGTGGKCTQPDCEVCWPDEPVNGKALPTKEI